MSWILAFWLLVTGFQTQNQDGTWHIWPGNGWQGPPPSTMVEP